VPRDEEGQRCLPRRAFGDRGAEGDGDVVAALADQARAIDAPAAEGVGGLQHGHAVQADFGNRIQPFDHQIAGRAVMGEAAGGDPVAFADPAQVVFVAAPIGIGDRPALMQRGDAVAGDGEGHGIAALRIGKGPDAA